MTRLTRCPATVDRERSEADYRDVLLEFGRKPPADGERRSARAKHLKRILAVYTECQKLDDLSRRPLDAPFRVTLPAVFRPYPRGLHFTRVVRKPKG